MKMKDATRYSILRSFLIYDMIRRVYGITIKKIKSTQNYDNISLGEIENITNKIFILFSPFILSDNIHSFFRQISLVHLWDNTVHMR